MSEEEYYYYFGCLEKNVGYNKNEQISIDELKEKILSEQLDEFCKVEFYPKTVTQPDMIALIKKNDKFGVLKTGEKGSGYTITFEEIGYALNYMLASLRFKKQGLLQQNEQKKTLQ